MTPASHSFTQPPSPPPHTSPLLISPSLALCSKLEVALTGALKPVADYLGLFKKWVGGGREEWVALGTKGEERGGWWRAGGMGYYAGITVWGEAGHNYGAVSEGT